MPGFVLKLLLSATLLGLVIPISYSQTFFGSQPQSGNQATGGNAPSQTMSAQDFRNRVKQLNQQTSKNLSQQAADALPKQPSGIAPSPAESQQATTPPPSQLAAPTTPSGGQQFQAPPPRDVYTGFSGTPPSQKPQRQQPSSGGSGNSGGWNINY